MDFNFNRLTPRANLTFLVLTSAVILTVATFFILTLANSIVGSFFDDLVANFGSAVSSSSSPAVLLAGIALVFLFRKGQV